MNKLMEFLERKYTKTEAACLISVIFIFGVGLDILLGNMSFFSIFFSVVLIIVGNRQRKKGKTLSGNIFLITGVLFLLGAILTSLAFYLVVGTIAIYFFYHLYKSSENAQKIRVNLDKKPMDAKEFVKVEPFFQNMLVGEMRSIEDVYELDDVNIQYGFGDVHIDLSYALIPEGETVILIRGMIGNIHLYVPYDIDLSVQTSVLFGKTSVLKDSKTTFNLTQKFQTAEYKSATRKIKIVATLLVGDVEVRNV